MVSHKKPILKLNLKKIAQLSKVVLNCGRRGMIPLTPLPMRYWFSNYRPQRSCGQGYVFTRVCDSVKRGVSASVHAGIPTLPGGRHPPGADTPPWSRHPPRSRHPPGADTPPSRLRDTVNERPVRILLECILVFFKVPLIKILL